MTTKAVRQTRLVMFLLITFIFGLSILNSWWPNKTLSLANLIIAGILWLLGIICGNIFISKATQPETVVNKKKAKHRRKKRTADAE